MSSVLIITLYSRWACIYMNLPSRFDSIPDTYCLSLFGCIDCLRESSRVVCMVNCEVYLQAGFTKLMPDKCVWTIKTFEKDFKYLYWTISKIIFWNSLIIIHRLYKVFSKPNKKNAQLCTGARTHASSSLPAFFGFEFIVCNNCAHMCALVSAIDVKKKMYYKYLKSFSNVFIVQKILCTVYVLWWDWPTQMAHTASARCASPPRAPVTKWMECR